MEQVIKNTLRPTVHRARRFIRKFVANYFDIDRAAQQTQRSIINQYHSFKISGIVPYRNIKDAGFRMYSQFEEDGIILYILSMIGFKTRRVVEMCCGSGSECMAANLIVNHGFDGFLFDGNPQNIRDARAFFGNRRDCYLYPPTVMESWITVENVNDILKKAGCLGEVDVLSLDLDGNDYWILNAIDAIKPRLIVAEIHNIIPTDRSITIKYEPNFSSYKRTGSEQDYRGVSLLAMQKLCKRRGYRMIGAHRHGFNVFFLNETEDTQVFREVSIEEICDNHWTRSGQKHRWPLVKDMNWEEVEM